MKDHALRIMLFFYCISGGLVIVDTTLAAPMGMICWTRTATP